MVKAERLYHTNLDRMETRYRSVSEFRNKYEGKTDMLVGGLLDYGYDDYEIAVMLGSDSAKIRRIMRHNEYKLFSELNPLQEGK